MYMCVYAFGCGREIKTVSGTLFFLLWERRRRVCVFYFGQFVSYGEEGREVFGDFRRDKVLIVRKGSGLYVRGGW